MCQANSSDAEASDRSEGAALQSGPAKVCKCIRCSVDMENYASIGLQPLRGLAFMTRGHYGSAYFDRPDSGGPSYLEIAVCDKCVEQLERDGLLCRVKLTPVRSKNLESSIEERSDTEVPAAECSPDATARPGRLIR